MELIKQYFPSFSDDQLRKLEEYGRILRDWNQKVNLISRKNEEQIQEQHILHSLSIIKLIQFQPFSDVLDLGTGGGLPGIPLAIAFPKTKFHLVDSIGKKISAIENMIEHLELQNATAEQVRVEKHHGTYDFVVTRAVTNTKQLTTWTKHLFKDYHEHELKNGLFALKGGDLKVELSEIKRFYKVIHLNKYFAEEFFETKKIVYVQMKK